LLISTRGLIEMLKPMPSPNGSNFERLYISGPTVAAYDARGGLADIFDGLTPEAYGRRAYRRLAYDDNPSAGQEQSDPNDDTGIANLAAWIRQNMSYEAFSKLVMALQDDDGADDGGTGIGEEADQPSSATPPGSGGSTGSQPGGATEPQDLSGTHTSSKFSSPTYSEGSNIPGPEGALNVYAGNMGKQPENNEIKPEWQSDRTVSMKDFPSWNNSPKITSDRPPAFRGRPRTGGRGGAQDDPPDFRGRPHTGGKMTAMDGGTSPFYGSLDSAPPRRRAPALSAAERLSLDDLCPGLSRIKIL
jgi:hypothetical protein